MPFDIARELALTLVGQPDAIAAIAPAVRMFQAGLSPTGRPIAVFLLAGPTGVGKTKTVEALARACHGSERKLIRIDCGEFQDHHQICRLLGAPPGYLGHRETVPMLTQAKLNDITSNRSGFSIVLFDEIEKAAPSMFNLLLGILDKACLTLGDNSTVDFSRTVVFMTSNLGAHSLAAAAGTGYALGAFTQHAPTSGNLKAIALNAIKRKFSPEFVNRIDAVIPYRTLSAASLAGILDQQIAEIQAGLLANERVNCTLGVSPKAKRFLLAKGTSDVYGARELKRTLQRELLQPFAATLLDGVHESGAAYSARMNAAGDAIVFRTK